MRVCLYAYACFFARMLVIARCVRVCMDVYRHTCFPASEHVVACMHIYMCVCTLANLQYTKVCIPAFQGPCQKEIIQGK